MDIRTTQIQLIKILAETTDAGILSQIAKILNPQKNQKEVWGYDAKGKLITEDMMMQILAEAKLDRAEGRLISQDDLEKEAENW